VTSLTRVDAQARARLLDVEAYEVALDLTGGEHVFGSVTTVRFGCTEPGAATFVDVAAATLRSARLNGTELDVDAAYDPVARRLRLDALAAGNELVVDAVMAYSHDGEGLHRHVDPADGRVYLYAMSFLDAAPRWFACFDQPDLKAPMSFEVRCPADWTVAGNGPARELGAGRWAIASTAALATYFTTLVAGPYHVVTDAHEGIPLSLRVRQSLAEHLDRDAGSLFAHTKRCLTEFQALFGVEYPWGEYHQAFVPEFNAGAMENPGCVTFRDTLVFRSRVTDSDRITRDVTIAHEMAHMWFGDLVTMRWWDDLWLNESFAEYLGYRVTGGHSWVSFGASRKSWGFAADRRPSTHPVAGNGAADAKSALSEFDGISYAKGASVLRQLAVQLGDEVFLDGLRRYIEQHAGGNAELADLLRDWADAGAGDIDAWTSAWLTTTGLDTLSARDGQVLRHSPEGAARVHAIEVAVLSPEGAERASARVTVAGEQVPTGLRSPGVVLPDARDEAWAKLALSASTWQAMPRLLPGVSDARTRVAVWNALQLATADAEVDPMLAIDIVTAALPAEADDSVVGAVGRWATRAICGLYLDGEQRREARARVAGALLGAAEVVPPGSARQLAAVRVVIAVTSDANRLHDWLGGRDLPPGLAVDAELRWSIVERLARLGELDDAAIGAEAAADHSSAGEVHAARCRAARPDKRAKRAAWNAIMHDADRPNYELYALADGFWDPDQLALTEPYVARYFEQVPGTATLRSGWVVERLALMAYPWPVVTDEVHEAGRRLLADPRLDQRVRRSVTDADDDLHRALAVRRRYP
jgi:aminopeptidase N